jgi:hypothetical protein
VKHLWAGLLAFLFIACELDLANSPEAIGDVPEDSARVEKEPVADQPASEGDKKSDSPFVEEIVFRDSNNRSHELRLRLEMPQFQCPEDTELENVCFQQEPHRRQALVFDPGHDDTHMSLRNCYHNEINEGQANMVVSLLAREMILRCLKKPNGEQAIPASDIRLSRWPGEIKYGDYVSGREPGKGLGSLNIHHTGGGALADYITDLLKLGSKDAKRGVVISVHADAPDALTETARRREYPFVLFRQRRASSADLARHLYDAMIERAAPYYDDADAFRQNYASRTISSGSTLYYPELRLHGVNNPGMQSRIELAVDETRVNMKASVSLVAAILRAGESSVGGRTTGTGIISKDVSSIQTRVNETHVVLLEGFNMEGAVVGASIQKQLQRENSPLIKASYYEASPMVWREIPIYENIISHVDLSGSYAKCRWGRGQKRSGYRIADYYVDYARAIVQGVARSYSCSSKK